MIKFIHCADMHLDAAFSGLSQSLAAQRRKEARESFIKLADLADKEKVDMILFAGDTFDGREVSGETAKMIIESAEKYENILFIMVPGNHDYYVKGEGFYSRGDLPCNIHIFTEEKLAENVFSIRDERVRVCGYAFTSPSLDTPPFREYKPENDCDYNILLAHGNTMSSGLPDCPITIEDIEHSGFDYIALGHIHNSDGIKKLGNTYYGYSGHIEPRSFADRSVGGVYLVEMDKKEKLACKYEFVRLAEKKYTILHIKADTMDMFEEKVRTLSQSQFGENDFIRVIFEGRIKENEKIPKKLLSELLSKVGALEIKDETTPAFDVCDLDGDITVFGEVKKLLSDKLLSEDERECDNASLALKYALAALLGDDLTED